MSPSTRKVLITGCSDGGLGAALAFAFHEAGLEVYATARDPSKTLEVASQGIKTLCLDVQSNSSIAKCVGDIPELDILVNNTGGGYVKQAFLPLLLKSKGMIVNHTSLASLCTVPLQSAYNAYKAAMASFSDSERLELKPFGGSIYKEAEEVVGRTIRGAVYEGSGMPSQQWAKEVVMDILKSSSPTIWRGAQAWIVRIGRMLPFGALDSTVKKFTGLDEVERIVEKPNI
ncbi:Short-chain dehydrogenase/reductase SDR [Penicillium vulpinum]|uniref:Short-chain dehydrogenase/reductase SDR n=1 Tax=Penicillium vulpinum TaxID=29845 RepID=UPI0025471914|nr:Short-chain dehydrogenase/reductase SDR [Penicillium vulpinum]KAJ5958092.1 Short-chain dehydrogenase/reductase SDR [Penicillium vulpinum]